MDDLRQDNKEDIKLVVKDYIRVWKLLCHAFFKAVYSNSFLIFLTMESIINWLLSIDLIANSGLLVTSINHGTLFLR